MACKGSGVQIPSAPPQVNGPLRRRPPANPRARAANRQQSALKGRSSGRHGVAPASIADVVARQPRAPPGGLVVRNRTGSAGTARSITDQRADLILIRVLPTGSFPGFHMRPGRTMYRWRQLGSVGVWTKRGPNLAPGIRPLDGCCAASTAHVLAAGARIGQLMRLVELTVVVRSVRRCPSDVARGWHGQRWGCRWARQPHRVARV